MEVRVLTQEEKAQAGFVSSFCFHNRFDDDLAQKEEEWMQSVTEIWGAIENGKVMSVIYNNRSEVLFDGVTIPQFGVGGVSTLPEYRNKGCSKQILEAMLKNEYNRGTVISALFPFSTSFYRKFGFDVATKSNTYTLKPEYLKSYKFNGDVVMYKPGDDYTPYAKLFNEFVKDYNLSVVRNETSWGWKMPKNVFKNRRFAYLLKENNEDIAYVMFKDIESEEAILEVTEIVWKNKKGFNAILGFLGRFSADYGTIKISLPVDMELHLILKTDYCYRIEKYTHIDYMLRAVNAKRALEIMKKPLNCKFIIKINDPIIKENCKTYLVTNDKVIETNEKCDIEASIEGFSQLVFGVISLKESLLRDDVIIYNNEDNLKEVFYKKPFIVTQFF